MKILIGADPELFVSKAGKFVSGHGMVPGTKDKPFRVPSGAVQVDGMALEFNIDPAADEEGFITNINTVIRHLAEMIPGYDLNAVPVAHFGKEYIDSQPLEARELGCTPDFNAWEDGAENIKPDAELPYRTGAGHVHIGWTKDTSIDSLEHRNNCIDMVKQLDFYLGLPSLFYDNDVDRRAMYGKAGCCRFKPYGVEYRVLSNKWLSDKKLTSWVYRATMAGANALMEGNFLPDTYGDIQAIINKSDKTSAMEIIRAAGLEVPHAA